MDQLEIPAVKEQQEREEQEKAEREARIEQERMEWVFGLTGGELSDRKWECANEEGEDATFKWWYDGVPEYAESDFPERHDLEHRTVLCYGGPPEVLVDKDGRWYLQRSYSSSGETECPVAQADEDVERPCCLCEAEEGEEHGHIYVGDGWCEAVYREDPVREVIEA